MEGLMWWCCLEVKEGITVVVVVAVVTNMRNRQKRK